MIDEATHKAIAEAVRKSVGDDSSLLESLRIDMREQKSKVRKIQQRSATAISLVGTDGGNNQLRYDPFIVQLIRVVDSSNNEYCIEVVTPNSNIPELNLYHMNGEQGGPTILGRLMLGLGIKKLEDLSPVFVADVEKRSPSWVQVYREMHEWAVLLKLVREHDFATDTVVVFDGFLRSKMFKKGLFSRLKNLLEDSIKSQYKKNRRRIFIAGIAKHTKFLQKYRLAMSIEGVMKTAYPCYLDVDRKLEAKAYTWSEYVDGGSELESMVAGKMFLTKFGSHSHDPIWAIDIFESQVDSASTVFGYLLSDSVDGFPVPFYPQCLQRAHENAALVDFDMDIMQDEVMVALRSALAEKKWAIDELSLENSDPSNQRYN